MRRMASSVRKTGSVGKFLQRRPMHPHHFRGALLHAIQILLAHGLDHKAVPVCPDLAHRLPIDAEQIQNRALENEAKTIADRSKLLHECHGPWWLEHRGNIYLILTPVNG